MNILDLIAIFSFLLVGDFLSENVDSPRPIPEIWLRSHWPLEPERGPVSWLEQNQWNL